MSNHPLNVVIASVPDRDELVAEIWLGNEQVAEVTLSAEEGFLVEFYPRLGGQSWKVSVQTILDALEDAKRQMLEEK